MLNYFLSFLPSVPQNENRGCHKGRRVGAAETSWRMELFKKRLEEVQKQPFTVTDLKVNGFDVMKELNCKPGPLIGKTLNQLFSEVEAGTLKNEREILLTRMKELKKENLPN